MIKTKFGKILILLIVLDLILLTLWLAMIYLAQKERDLLVSSSANKSAVNSSINYNFLGREKIKLLDSYFLNASSTVSFLEQLESLGQQTGVELTIGQAEEKNNELKLSLSVKGVTFVSVFKFLQGLENLPFAAKVDRFELRKIDKGWQGDFVLIVLQTKK